MDNNRILGIDFFGGSLQDAVATARSGGLCVAPSGPGLAGDLTSCSSYAEALTQADLVLPDSGLMCLWTKLFFSRPIRRISGIGFSSGLPGGRWRGPAGFLLDHARSRSEH